MGCEDQPRPLPAQAERPAAQSAAQPRVQHKPMRERPTVGHTIRWLAAGLPRPRPDRTTQRRPDALEGCLGAEPSPTARPTEGSAAPVAGWPDLATFVRRWPELAAAGRFVRPLLTDTGELSTPQTLRDLRAEREERCERFHKNCGRRAAFTLLQRRPAKPP